MYRFPLSRKQASAHARARPGSVLYHDFLRIERGAVFRPSSRGGRRPEPPRVELPPLSTALIFSSRQDPPPARGSTGTPLRPNENRCRSIFETAPQPSTPTPFRYGSPCASLPMKRSPRRIDEVRDSSPTRSQPRPRPALQQQCPRRRARHEFSLLEHPSRGCRSDRLSRTTPAFEFAFLSEQPSKPMRRVPRFRGGRALAGLKRRSLAEASHTYLRPDCPKGQARRRLSHAERRASAGSPILPPTPCSLNAPVGRGSHSFKAKGVTSVSVPARGYQAAARAGVSTSMLTPLLSPIKSATSSPRHAARLK